MPRLVDRVSQRITFEGLTAQRAHFNGSLGDPVDQVCLSREAWFALGQPETIEITVSAVEAKVETCPVCGQPVGQGERGPLVTCGRNRCINTLLHRRGQSHDPSECADHG